MAQPLILITSRQAYIFAVFLVFYEFLAYIANDMIMPGMIHVVKTFNGPESAVANALTVYILGGASLQIFLGPISDRYGRRPVMLFGVSLFLFCTLFIAVSASMEQFLVARFFQGMGLCFISVVGYATLQEIFAEKDAIRLIAIMGIVAALSPLFGPLLGALFLHFYSWRFIFVMIAAFNLIVLLGLWQYMPESVGQVKRDGEKIKRVPLSVRVILGNYKQLLLNPIFVSGAFAFGILIIPCMVWIALAPLILIADAKLSVIQYALWQIPVFSAAIMGALLLQYLTHYFSSQRIIKIAASISVFSLLLVFILILVAGQSFVFLMPGIILYFFSLGLGSAPLMRLILFSTQIAKGTTSAFIWLIVMCMQAGGVELANLLYGAGQKFILASYFALLGIVYLFFVRVMFVEDK